MDVGKKRYFWWIIGFLLFISPLSAAAEQEPQLIPMGITAGIRLDADGLLVLGMVETADGEPPAAYTAGLRSGDLITHVGAFHVTNVEELRSALEQAGDVVTLRFLRAGVEQQINLRPEQEASGKKELGVYLRSSISGIGTITYYDPTTKTFGALGHGVSDGDTGVLLPVKDGMLGKAQLDTIIKGSTGNPGELKGTLGLEHSVGVLTKNTSDGIFGLWNAGEAPGFPQTAIPAGSLKSLECGAAQLISDVSGKRESYAIQILHVFREGQGRDLLIQVTDHRLLSLTGGIVQGMSGSPILQSGKLIGAVTHVLVSDPAKGYGISIERMLDAAA